MMKFIYEWMLFTAVTRKLDIKIRHDACITHLEIYDYTYDAFKALGFITVKQAVIAWALHKPTPGIGEKTWDDFFRALRQYSSSK